MQACKRILTVIAASEWEDLQVVVERTTPFFSAAGFRRIVAMPDLGLEMNGRLWRSGCVVFTVHLHRPRKTSSPLAHLGYLWAFEREVRAIEDIIAIHRIDVVEVVGLSNLQPVVAARRAGKPLVWQIHSTLAPAPVRQVIARIAGRVADVVMTSGKAMASGHRGLTSGKAKVIPFCAPVELKHFYQDADTRERVRGDLGFAADDIVVGTLGNRGWQQRHEWIVHIADRMQGRQKLKFAIIGPPVETNDRYYASRVERPIRALALGNVQVINQRHSAREVLNAIDIFILPSVTEGASLVAAEAMACGLPIIASDLGSLRDIVHPHVNGFLCRGSSVSEFCDAIEKLTDPELRSAMGLASRELASATLGSQPCAEAHFRSYSSAIIAGK